MAGWLTVSGPTKLVVIREQAIKVKVKAKTSGLRAKNKKSRTVLKDSIFVYSQPE